METAISSLLQVFATISSISTAFSVLIFESWKNKGQNAEKHLLDEMRNLLSCGQLPEEQDLKSSEVFEKLQSTCKKGTVDIELFESVLELLKRRIQQLRTQLNGLSTEEIAKRTKRAAHMEQFHADDIQAALEEFKIAKGFLSNFRQQALGMIIVPLVISTVFLSTLLWRESIVSLLGDGFLKIAILMLAACGFAYIFVTTASSIKKLL